MIPVMGDQKLTFEIPILRERSIESGLEIEEQTVNIIPDRT